MSADTKINFADMWLSIFKRRGHPAYCTEPHPIHLTEPIPKENTMTTIRWTSHQGQHLLIVDGTEIPVDQPLHYTAGFGRDEFYEFKVDHAALEAALRES